MIKRICVAIVAAFMLFHPLAAQASEPTRKLEHVGTIAKYRTGGGFVVTTDQEVTVRGDHQVLVCTDQTTGLTIIGQGLITVEAEAQYLADGTCRPYVEGESNQPAAHDGTLCEEDEPCWDCETMGNLICGPVTE
jgi:hypothetical protein